MSNEFNWTTDHSSRDLTAHWVMQGIAACGDMEIGLEAGWDGCEDTQDWKTVNEIVALSVDG